MARVTVEDCIEKVENRFELVLLASHRARPSSWCCWRATGPASWPPAPR